MTPRGAILEATRSALSALASGPVLYTSFSEVLQADAPRSLVIGPGAQESIEGETHAGVSVRGYPVRVICTAWTREEADQLSVEVEAGLTLSATVQQLGAHITSVDFTESSTKSERVFFSSIVNLDVSYETTSA